ncbi:MAG: DUF494 domain-containing protein [Gammaproteobacteria bacterium]
MKMEGRMKGSVLDVLIYLAEEYETAYGEENEREQLTLELVAAGFDTRLIGDAWGWLDELVILIDSNSDITPFNKLNATRLLSPAEKSRLSLAAQSFLLLLQSSDLIDTVTFELILDRLIALESDSEELSLDQIRWVVLMVAFNRSPELSHFSAIESLVFAEPDAPIH